jgi:hypothetical protein
MASSKQHAALVSLGLAGAAVLFAFDPAATSWFPSCPLNALTGWLCPFCGTLRAVHALLRGHVEAAVALNPLTTAGVAAGLAAFTHDAMRPTRPALVDRLVSLAFSAPGLALAAIFGVVRNMR